jgi:hypothetical protein
MKAIACSLSDSGGQFHRRNRSFVVVAKVANFVIDLLGQQTFLPLALATDRARP